MTRIEALKIYMLSCIQAEDWHGARDAIVDIEVELGRLEGKSRKRPKASPAILGGQGQSGSASLTQALLEEAYGTLVKPGRPVPGNAGTDGQSKATSSRIPRNKGKFQATGRISAPGGLDTCTVYAIGESAGTGRRTANAKK